MANYKVGDLEVTINGVSKDAVSSLAEVIKQLDTLQGKLGIVSKGFGGAFKDINRAAVKGIIQDFDDIQQVAENATVSQKEWNGEIENGEVNAQQYSTSLVAVSQAQDDVGSSFRRLISLLNVSTYNRLSSDVGNLATQWKNLYTTMQMSNVADELTGGQFSQEAQNRITRITQEYLNKKRAIDKTNEAFKRMAMTEQELALYDYQQENASRKQRIAYLNLMLTTKQAGKKTREYKKELQQLTQAQKQADKTANKSAKGGLSKLIGRISRIALYRTIRRGLQIITQTFNESIQAYAQVDDNINKMMSRLTSSTKIIQLSLGTIIFPILQAITPVVQQISVGFSNMANAINKSMALAQGNATYTKINTEALQDYRKELNKTSGALFDFDKFRALSSKQDTASIFLSAEEVSALDEVESKYSGIYMLVSGLGDILEDVFNILDKVGSPAIRAVLDVAQPIVTTIASAVNGLTKLIDKLDELGLLEPIIKGITYALIGLGAIKVITSISKLTGSFSKLQVSLMAVGAIATIALAIMDNWSDMNAWQKAISVIGVLTSAVFGLALAFGALHSAWSIGVAAAAIVAGIAAVVASINSAKNNIPNYAVGASNIDSGSLFVAGEAGKTEMVYTGDNGKTNVANIQQMYQAEYAAVLQALKDYGAARGEMPQLQPASDTGIYQAAKRGAGKHGEKFVRY